MLGLTTNSFGAEATSSDKFAQVRGFKVEISGAVKTKVSSSSSIIVLKKNDRVNLVKMLNDMPEMVVFKTLPIPGASIALSSGVSAEEMRIRFVVQEIPFQVVDELRMKQLVDGVELEMVRIIGSRKDLIEKKELIGSPLVFEIEERGIIAAREAGSGMATGRRMSSVICVSESDCLLAQEILDLRQIVKKAFFGREGQRVQTVRYAKIAGEYPSSLIQASSSLEKLTGVSLKIGDDEVLGFNFTNDENSSLVSNPLYQASGNSGENPLFEGRSSSNISIRNIEIPSNFQWRCSDGSKKGSNQLCGTTDHL